MYFLRSHFIFLALIGVSSMSLALPSYLSEEEKKDSYFSLIDNGKEYPAFGYIQLPVPLNQEFNFLKLKELIINKKLKTIESVIAELPDYMLNNNYVVMYRSRSLQQATIKSPRIITFTPTARFILSFNDGNNNLKGNSNLEIIQFNDQEARFEFREIVFGNGQQLPTISEANPKKCLGCHQSPYRKNIDMRPNWEPYATWPGVIGSNDGSFSALEESNNMKYAQQPQDSVFIQEQKNEKQIADEFLNTIAPQNPRYSQLGKLNLKTPVGFTQLLSVLNFQRIIRMISEDSVIFSSHQEILELLGKCHEASVESGDIYNGFNSEIFDQILELHKNATDLNKYPKPYFEQKNTKFSDRLTWIFEGLGIDTSDWSMDLGTGGRFAFMERFGVPSHAHVTFAAVWQERYPFSPKRCLDLLAIAKEKLKKFFAAPVKIESPTPIIKSISATQILKHCSTCHTDSLSSAPLIPFDNPQELKKVLYMPLKKTNLMSEILSRTNDMAESGRQMPPDRRLTTSEHNILKQYLEAL